MTWEQWYRLKLAARTSLVLWAVIALAAAICCARTVRLIDEHTEWAPFHYPMDGARNLLGILAGSMLTFIVFVLSATLIVVQLASGQLTPRIIAIVLSTPTLKLALATLTFTYVYTLAAIANIRDVVPDLHVSIAIILNLLSIIVFFRFVQQLAGGLRPVSLMHLVAVRARPVFEQVYPTSYDPAHPEQAMSGAIPTSPAETIEFTGRSGMVMAFGLSRLIRLAVEADAVIELVPQVGDSICQGDPLFRVYRSGRAIPPAVLQGCVAVGIERTLDLDPRFAFRILVDIANKALSPAINDPTTAVLSLDQIDNLLLCLGKRRLDEGLGRDWEGKVRVVYGTPDWPDFVTLAISEIRQFGEGSLQVDRRMKAMLEHLIASLPEARKPALQQELVLLSRSVARKFPDEEDRKLAGIGDFQGMGGSDS